MPNVDFDIAQAARRIVEGSLGVVAGDRVVIMVDAPRVPLGAALVEAASAVGGRPELVQLDVLGRRPVSRLPQSLRDRLADAQATVLLVSFEDGEWAMRADVIAAVGDLDLRHAHMVGLGRRAFLTGFSVDPQRILDVTRAVRMRLRPDSVFELRSQAGSHVQVRLDPRCRWQERVGLIRPGRWENLPSGELFTCPADVNGTFVADGCMGAHIGARFGLLDGNPVRLEIKAGVVRSIHCADRAVAAAFDAFVHAERGGDRVGMVILGTNVGIHELTGEIICDQNLPGLHLGFGATFPAQTGASWDAATQISLTATGADVDLDGAPLLRNGRYLVL